MSNYLLDTNHASAMFRKLPKPQDRIRASTGDQFLLSRPSIGELWYMVFNSARVDENQHDMLRFVRTFQQLEFDADAAVEFGKIKSELRQLGRPIPSIDIQIAAIARIQNLTLLTADAHFSVVANLRTENWLI